MEKFEFLAGYESNDPTQDNNYSQSILAGYVAPSYVTGLRTVYVLSKTLTLDLGINNGWDDIINNNGGDFTLEIASTWSNTYIFADCR